MQHALTHSLLAVGPHRSLGEHAATYGRVIGSWRGRLHNQLSSPPNIADIEVHFGWVLDGRAVQDVWITPARGGSEREGAGPGWFGTTLRVFDPARTCWRVIWSDPPSQRQIALEGRRVGDDVVQLGLRDGQLIRWTFRDIRADSFVWQGHVLEADGETWRLEISIELRRSEH